MTKQDENITDPSLYTVQQDLDHIVGRLSRTIEYVESHRTPSQSMEDPDVRDFGSLASDVVHEIATMVANLGLDGLVRDCSRADQRERSV